MTKEPEKGTYFYELPRVCPTITIRKVEHGYELCYNGIPLKGVISFHIDKECDGYSPVEMTIKFGCVIDFEEEEKMK